MQKDKNKIEEEIRRLEEEMSANDFWTNKDKAQTVIRKIRDLKQELEGVGKYDAGNAIVTIISGAGGDDAEDFARMLAEMYYKFAKKKTWDVFLIHEHVNEHVGYKSMTFEISNLTRSPLLAGEGGERLGPYGLLQKESGVHRLVRVSPFNAQQKRHTSFAMVEVIPKFSKLEEKDVVLNPEDLKIEFSRAGGPGGQNVNKRETAVRIVHIPTNISASASAERSQEQNKERALAILRAKIFKKAEEEKESIEESMKTGKGQDIEWGSQIRSYVLHPYKMVKDHRTDVETSDVEGVLNGDLDLFIQAEKDL